MGEGFHVEADPAGQPRRPRAVGELQRAELRIRVDPFVEPRLLELVGPDHPVPVLVPEFVDRDVLDDTDSVQRPAQEDLRRVAGDERRILHPSRAEAVLRRIHDGQGLVGIGAEPEPVEGEPDLRRADVPVERPRVVRLEQEPHGDGSQGEPALGKPELPGGQRGPSGRNVGGRIEPEFMDLESRIGGPGEIMDVVGDVPIDRPAARLRFGDALARGAHDEGGRHRQGHVVVSVVGVELGVGVEGVAVPSSGRAAPHSGGLVDADLREPLPDEVEIPDEAGPRVDPRQPRAEDDRENDLAVRGNGGGERERRARSRRKGPAPPRPRGRDSRRAG